MSQLKIKKEENHKHCAVSDNNEENQLFKSSVLNLILKGILYYLAVFIKLQLPEVYDQKRNLTHFSPTLNV